MKRLECFVYSHGHSVGLKGKTGLNVPNSYIFCTTDVFATKLGVQMCM